jgi:hypothetical protein
MTFTGSGSFASAGPDQIITLTGTGTPTSEGDINVQITGACAFAVTVAPGTAATDLRWKFTAGGVTYEGPTDGVITLALSGQESTAIGGESDDGTYTFALTLLKPAPMQAGTFSSVAIPPANLASLLVIDGGGQQAFSALGPPAPGLTVVLTTYNETTRIAEGTFTGTVNKGGGGTAVITGGTFKATIL